MQALLTTKVRNLTFSFLVASSEDGYSVASFQCWHRPPVCGTYVLTNNLVIKNCIVFVFWFACNLSCVNIFIQHAGKYRVLFLSQ